MKQYVHQSSNRTVHIVTLYKYSQVTFYIRFMILKTLYNSKKCQLNKEFPFETVYFQGIRGLITSSCVVYNYH
jgi:hypothetical protein